jgi:hypothetical protein
MCDGSGSEVDWENDCDERCVKNKKGESNGKQ